MSRRSPVSRERAERIRRDRTNPQRSQWDYLHLHTLLEGLVAELEAVPSYVGPVLDVYCGTQPYRGLIPARPIYGLDIDRHFRSADVVADDAFPFPDATFGLVLCTQALYLARRPQVVAAEMRRVLRPGGRAIVTVPHIFLARHPAETRIGAARMRELFSGWDGLELRGLGGPGAGAAFCAGQILAGAARRWRVAAKVLPLAARVMNVGGAAFDRLAGPPAGRWPANYLLIARSPAEPGMPPPRDRTP